MSFDNDIGLADGGTKVTTNAQPVIPFELNDDWNFITRTIVPIIHQDDIFPDGGSQFGLGDVKWRCPKITYRSCLPCCPYFDVGVDLGSPVALDHFYRAPFRFNGKIEKIDIDYTDEKQLVFPRSDDD